MDNNKKTRKEQAKETKQKLFDVAFKMLEEKPYDDIKIRDIVTAAGVSTGTFYLYYKTKLDVYYETYVLADEYFDTVVRKSVARLKTTQQKIRKFFKEYGRYSNEITSLALTKLLYNADNKCFNRVSENGMHSLLRDIVKEGLVNGELKCDDSEKNVYDICRFFMLSARGQVYDWCTMDGEYDLVKALDEMIVKLLKVYS